MSLEIVTADFGNMTSANKTVNEVSSGKRFQRNLLYTGIEDTAMNLRHFSRFVDQIQIEMLYILKGVLRFE